MRVLKDKEDKSSLQRERDNESVLCCVRERKTEKNSEFFAERERETIPSTPNASRVFQMGGEWSPQGHLSWVQVRHPHSHLFISFFRSSFLVEWCTLSPLVSLFIGSHRLQLLFLIYLARVFILADLLIFYCLF